MRRGPLLISFAILAAAFWIASVFRYEYLPNAPLRVDRWTGEKQVNCVGPGLGWASFSECNAAVARQRADDPFAGAVWDKPKDKE
jgi:hypothetical protein